MIGSKTKKFFLVIFSIFLCFFLLEMGLRLSGSLYLIFKSQSNKMRLHQKTELTLLCIGESMTALGGDDSYPSQLENILNTKYPHQTFQVINQGVPGVTSEFFADRMQMWIDQYHPDIVLVMLGINDELTYVNFDQGGLIKNLYSKLQIYKLYKWISMSLESRAKQKEASPQEISPNRIKETYPVSQEHKKMLIFSGILENQKKYSEAEKIYRYLLQTDIDERIKHRVKLRLIEVLDKQKKYLEIVKLFPVVPHFAWGNSWINELCAKNKDLDVIEATVKQVISENPTYYFLYDLLGVCFEEAGDLEKAQENKAMASSLRTNKYKQRTYNSYKSIVHTLKKNGIQGVYIQYPLRNVDYLKVMLSQDFNIGQMVFVENKKIFEKAVGEEGYEAFFSDRFAGDIGHCTQKGNNILANNVALELAKNKLIQVNQ